MKKLIKYINPNVTKIIGKRNVLEFLKKYANELWDIHDDNGYTYSYTLKIALDEMCEGTLHYFDILCEAAPYIFVKKISKKTYMVEMY